MGTSELLGYLIKMLVCVCVWGGEGLGVTMQWNSITSWVGGGVVILLNAFFYRKQDELSLLVCRD